MAEGRKVTLAGQSAEPVEGVANGGLSGLVAENPENAVFYDAGDSGNAAFDLAVEHMAGSRCP